MSPPSNGVWPNLAMRCSSNSSTIESASCLVFKAKLWLAHNSRRMGTVLSPSTL